MNARTLAFAPLLLLGTMCFAQQQFNLSGTITTCAGYPYPIRIELTNGLDTLFQTDANCTYSFTLDTDLTQLNGVVRTSCDGGTSWASSVIYWTPLIGDLVIDLNCFMGPGDCNACFESISNEPWVVDLMNCTSGGTPPYTYAWDFDGLGTSELAEPTLTLPQVSGYHIINLFTTDADGCAGFDTDSITVSLDGTVYQGFVACAACLEVTPLIDGLLGTVTPWAVSTSNCSVNQNAGAQYVIEWGDGTSGGTTHTYAGPGTYTICMNMSDNLYCTPIACESITIDNDGNVTLTAPEDCAVEFFVMQAYQWVDSAANANGGGGAAVPNELWLWYLTSNGFGDIEFLWNWGDGSTSTDPYPSHTYASGGTYTICLTITDALDCTSTYCYDITVGDDGILGGFQSPGNRSTFTVTVMNPLTTGMTETPTLTTITAWPNPVNDVLNLTLESSLKGNLRIDITDMSGRVVFSGTRTVNGGRANLSIPVAEFNAGMYLISISNGTTNLSERFVKVL